MLGCAKPQATVSARAEEQASFAEQAEAVRRGEADAIRSDQETIDDGDLEQLDGLEDLLRRVNLSKTNISDEGLARLASMHKLIQLRLASDRVSDEGLKHVAKMKELRHLHLIDAPITDQGLEHLCSLDKLESLYLDRTGATDAGAAGLQEGLPGVHLHVDGGHPRGTSSDEAAP